MKLKAKIKSLAYGGEFVGEVLEPEDKCGKKIFIREVIPGELVEASTLEDLPRLIRGKADKIIEASPERCPAPCPYFGSCGGCDLQHMDLQAQREAKLDMVSSMLRTQAKLEPELGFSFPGAELPDYAYRNRITLHLDTQGNLGFYKQGSNEVVDIKKCLISSDIINDALKNLRSLTKELAGVVKEVTIEDHLAKCFVLLSLRETSGFKELDGKANFHKLKKTFPNLTVKKLRKKLFSQEADAEVLVGHFSQVNEAANNLLVAMVTEKIRSDEITELYAGAGNFSIPLAEKGIKVTAVELDKALVNSGIKSAKKKKLSKFLIFYASSCEGYVKKSRLSSTVLLDPPRTGAKAVLKLLPENTVKRIVYVSCNLPTLCRDLQILTEKGFALKEVTLIDMFPQTHHIETISVMEKN